MPLVYGSTPEKTGTIKGTVKFECNYDCKGRDIAILYEAKAEAHWTENKKIVNHRTEEIFGHAIWHFPLEHTRPNGSTIVAGVYEKEFEVPLIHPSVSSALNRSSAANVSARTDASASVKAAAALSPRGSTALLPSSSYGPNTKIKYTIHAILRRPFPSITNVEASQEVWVLHSSMPPPPPQLPLPPKSAPATTTASKLKPSRGGRTEPSTLPSNPVPAVAAPSPSSSPADSAASTTAPNSASPSHSPSSAGESSDPQKLSSPRSLLSLSLPTKAIRSALSMLPLATIDLRSKQLSLTSITEKESNAEVERLVEPHEAKPSGIASSEAYTSTRPLSPSTSSPSTSSSSSQSATTRTDGYASDDTLPSSDDESDSDDENTADYTGVWEPFQMPYSCSLPSETVYLGQSVPLTIRFGPRKECGADRYKDKSRSRTGRKNKRKDREDGRQHQRNGHSKRRSERDHVVPQPRFVIKKGIVKVVEHTLLREVTVTPAPPALINHYNNTASVASGPMKNAHTLPSGSEATYDQRAGLLSCKQQQQGQQEQLELSGHVHSSTVSGGEPVILPSFAMNSLKSPIYQGQGYNGSNCHLYEQMDKDAKQLQQGPHRRSGEHKRSFFKSKRHSLDHVPDNHRSTSSESSHIGLHLSPAALAANDSSLSPMHRLPPPPPTATPSSSNSKIISSIEAKFKTEAMTISLTSMLQQRERQYQKLFAGKYKDGRGGLASSGVDTNEGNSVNDDDVDAERDLEDGIWQTTIYIPLPGLSDLATFTETKHIVKTHSLQLILLCGLVLDTNNGAGGGATPAIAGSGTGAPMPFITKPGINKEFRLETCCHWSLVTTMAFKRFSSLHTIILLATMVIFWLAWSNIRLREDTSSRFPPGRPPHGYGGTTDGRYNPEFEGMEENSGRPDPERDLPYVTDHTTSPLEHLTKNFTIVTAASSNHFCALESFLYSMSEVLEGLERTEMRPTLVVYNLGGMTTEQVAQLQYLKDNQYIDEYKDFDYAAYPAFWDISIARGEYGWKAGIIKEVADKYRGLVLWLDSGNMLALDFLRYLPGYLDKFGFWSPQSSGSFRQYTHEGLPQYYKDTLDKYAQETNCNGAAIAFDASNDKIYNGLLKEWFTCSSIKDCIAPQGSSRANHRQDQAALTYLVKRMQFTEQCRHFPEHYGVTVHQDKVCRERIRAYKIMKGLDQETDVMDEEEDDDEEAST
ncbi:hypothetical protein BGZ68_000843 [Mortierella alpina]|nr:hypothetical protein BGZ68_000843 [Mortierella alpina]